MSVSAKTILLAAMLLSALSACSDANYATPRPTGAPSNATSINRKDALTLPEPELARRVLGPMANIVNEMSRPTFFGLPGGDESLSYLAFATKPDSAGYGGLCEAKIISVEFSKIGDPEKLGTTDTQVRPTSISTYPRFKIVGKTEFRRMRTWTEDYIQQLKDTCVKSGRVLSTETGDFSQVGYFGLFETGAYRPAIAAWIASTVLQQAIESAKTSSGPMPSCADDDPECSDPLVILRGLNTDSLEMVGVGRCKESALTCVEGKFLRSAKFNETKEWSVKAEVEIDDSTDDSGGVGRTHKIEIESTGLIAD